ncbi:hypothetical protein AB1K83_07445 [Sporosarcina sp. 179-K 3D1 HS]|uniref:hypothetical protein n=1 Tax=Sporosarcina sp. 179-K 3D1 HS TaxID=3232169 RepID=UPI0039A3877F
MKKSFGYILGLIGLATAVLIVLGIKFDKAENEKQQGLTDVYDVSVDGALAYVEFEKGQAGLYVADVTEPLVQLPVEQTIVDVSFSKDGKTLAYIVSDKEVDSNSGSTVHLLDPESGASQLAFTASAFITELAFDPKDPNQLFYLQAEVFTNYSPIVGERPHDFDVQCYDLVHETHTRYTNMKKYHMQSLQVSSTDESVFVQMDDDENVETAEDVFASKQRIFQIPLDAPDEKTVISNPVGQDDIYDFLVLPERDELIYQAVGGTGADGIFEYELFSYNWKTHKTKQLTKLKEYASKPIRGAEDQIYFLVDRQFGERNPEFRIYQMSVEGKDVREIQR